MTKQAVGHEFKHSSYVVNNYDKNQDAVIIKERIHYDDGSTEPNIRIIRNYQKDFYIVKESERSFSQKRTWLPIEKCRVYQSNQAQLTFNAAKALKTKTATGMKVLNRSPYLGGTGVTPQVLIKHQYMTKYPNLVSYNTTCHLDIETDMLNPENEILMVSVSMGNKVFQAISRKFVEGIEDPINAIRDLHTQEILPKVWEHKIRPQWEAVCKERKVSTHDYPFTDYVKEFKGRYPITMDDAALDLEIIIVDREVDTVLETFKRVHAWKPDILSIWNLKFDIEYMIRALENAYIDPKDVFCDPCIPDDLRFFEFIPGAASTLDANGDSQNHDITERWHRVNAPSSFFWADQMVVRRRVRKHLPKEPSSKLGDILELEIGHGKLKGDNLTDASGPNWHIVMQRQHRIFYCVYNQWDNLGAQYLDEKCLDLCFVFTNQCQYSEWGSYASQGRRLSDDLYFFLLDKGYVLTGVSDKMESEFDKHSVPLEGWISTLAAHLINHEMGTRILEETDGVFTKIIKFVLDIDVKSSYPSTGCWMNIARDTIVRVACVLRNIEFNDQMRAGLNLPSGRVNALDIGHTIFNMPRPVEIMSRYERSTKGAYRND